MSDTAIQSMRGMLSGREAFRVAYSINPATGVESMARAWWCKYDQYQEAAKHLHLYADAGSEEETEYVDTPNAGRADSFPGKWVHSGCSQSQEADRLIQSLTRVYDITTNALLFARPAIPTFDNNILNLFGHKESEGDTLAVVIYALTKESRAFCMAITDADLTAGLIGGGFSYAGRRFDVDAETNSGRLTVAFEKVAHNAFVVGSPDLIWYSHKTTKQEQKHQLWMLVNKSDALTWLYTADAGYNVTTVSISPGEKGSLSIQRTQLLEAKGKAAGTDPVTPAEPYEETQAKTLNPHGFQSGTMDIILVKNHHLADPTTAYTYATPPAGYTLVDVDKIEEGNGLWTKVWKYEKPTWTAWGGAPSLTTYSGLSGNNASLTRIWEGIRIADTATAITACKNGTGSATVVSGYAIDGASASDNGNGSVTVRQVLRQDDDDFGDLTMFYNTRDDERINVEYEDREWYEPESGKPEVIRKHKAQFAVIRRNVMVETYVLATTAYATFFELTDTDHYTGVSLISGPRISLETNENGAKGYLVEAYYTKQVGDWILADDEFPAPPAPP